MKQSPKSDKFILLKIFEHCEQIEASILRFGNCFETFRNDSDFKNSVSMSMLQIGELAKGLTAEFKLDTKDEVSWKAIIGMRDLFAHKYGDMDTAIIWETAIGNVPALMNFCERTIDFSELDTELEQ